MEYFVQQFAPLGVPYVDISVVRARYDQVAVAGHMAIIYLVKSLKTWRANHMLENGHILLYFVDVDPVMHIGDYKSAMVLIVVKTGTEIWSTVR
jgi:hypothetical protein